MASEIFDLSKDFFKAACRQLRGQILGIGEDGEPRLSQDKMARMIPCSLSTYRQYEAGTRIPSGDILVRMLRLCDGASLRKFGLDISKLPVQYSSPQEPVQTPVNKYPDRKQAKTAEGDSPPKPELSDLIDHSPPTRKRPDGRRISRYVKS